MFVSVRAGVLAVLASALIIACSGSNGGPAPSPSAALGGSPVGPDVGPADVQLETSLATTYYEVSGSTTEAIFDDIEVNGPKDDQGRLGSGLTSVVWGYDWTGDRRGDGSCSIRSMTIRADMTIELPRHTNEAALPGPVAANWRQYADGVAEHEQRHVDIYLAGAGEIKSEMEAIGLLEDCDHLEEQIKTVWSDQQSRINGLQETFHSDESLRLAARRDPLEDQIEGNRARLQTLQQEISRLDAQIAGLRSDLDALDAEVQKVDSQIQQINNQFESPLPPNVRDRLEDLIAQSNELLTTYNARVEEHNAAFARRNSLANEYQALLTTTNQLVDDFNWAR